MRTVQTIKEDFEKMILEYPHAASLFVLAQAEVLINFNKQIESAKFAIGDIVNVYTDKHELFGTAYVFAIGLKENKICYHLKRINKDGGRSTVNFFPSMAYLPEAYEQYLEPYQAN